MTARGYWCEHCGRWIGANDAGLIVHDDVPHPADEPLGSTETLQ